MLPFPKQLTRQWNIRIDLSKNPFAGHGPQSPLQLYTIIFCRVANPPNPKPLVKDARGFHGPTHLGRTSGPRGGVRPKLNLVRTRNLGYTKKKWKPFIHLRRLVPYLILYFFLTKGRTPYTPGGHPHGATSPKVRTFFSKQRPANPLVQCVPHTKKNGFWVGVLQRSMLRILWKVDIYGCKKSKKKGFLLANEVNSLFHSLCQVEGEPRNKPIN